MLGVRKRLFVAGMVITILLSGCLQGAGEPPIRYGMGLPTADSALVIQYQHSADVAGALERLLEAFKAKLPCEFVGEPNFLRPFATEELLLTQCNEDHLDQAFEMAAHPNRTTLFRELKHDVQQQYNETLALLGPMGLFADRDVSELAGVITHELIEVAGQINWAIQAQPYVENPDNQESAELPFYNLLGPAGRLANGQRLIQAFGEVFPACPATDPSMVQKLEHLTSRLEREALQRIEEKGPDSVRPGVIPSTIPQAKESIAIGPHVGTWRNIIDVEVNLWRLDHADARVLPTLGEALYLRNERVQEINTTGFQEWIDFWVRLTAESEQRWEEDPREAINLLWATDVSWDPATAVCQEQS